jgi:hypothetical protein
MANGNYNRLNVFGFSKEGYRVHSEVLCSNFEDWEIKFDKTIAGFIKKGIRPTEERQPISKPPKSMITTREQENCNHPEWKEFLVKKAGSNQGKTFRKCTVCGKFEWVL